MEARPKTRQHPLEKAAFPSDHQVAISNTTRRYTIRQKNLTNLLQLILDYLGLGPCEVSVGFVSSAKMRTLNRTFRKKDQTTDVLSFPQCTWKSALKIQSSPGGSNQLHSCSQNPSFFGSLHLGDLVISIPEAEKNAEKIGQGLDREVCFLIVHGLLHLCGHDHMHPKEEKLMLRQQKKAMDILDQNTLPQRLAPRALWYKVIARRKSAQTLT